MTSVASASCLVHPLVLMATDDVVTDTSLEQVKTEQEIRQLLSLYIPQPQVGNAKPKAAVLDISRIELNRAGHVRWLTNILAPLPAPYTSLDASRPWLLYWVTHSLGIMNTSLDSTSKRRAVDTIKSFFNEKQGGFGGGPGQMAHLAPTYASVSALAYLDDGTGSAWDWIDRQALHDWLLSLKQADGSFVMHKGGEVDVRGCYCGLTVAVLLNILTPDLARGTFQFIASCQTYEGGLASASQPLPAGSPPLGEAHGGYTFCALASYFALLASPTLQSPLSPSSSTSASANSGQPSLNARNLLRWAAHMQGLPIEAGGFRGRTNKLVDGCYSWWCGGLFPILDAMIANETGDVRTSSQADLYNRVGLQEYVLIAAQGPHGGLRDKPGKGTDAYHSCYNLSGLASAQHVLEYSPSDLADDIRSDWVDITDSASASSASEAESDWGPVLVKGKNETSEEANQRMKDIFIAALSWKEEESRKIVIGRTDSASDNEVAPIHPVYNLTMKYFDKMMRWSYGQPPRIGLEEVSE